MLTITANGIRFAYNTYGDAAQPPLFLLHGLYGNRHLAGTANLFSERYHVITYDARGHNDSNKPPHYTLRDHGKDLLALIAAFGYEKAHVVGISMGSYIAAQTAVLDCSRIDKLVLLVTKGHGKTSSVLRFLTGKGLDPGQLNQEELMAYMDEALWSPHTSPARRKQLLTESQADQPADLKELTAAEKQAVDAALANFDLRPQLGQISVPTLVISGQSDGLNPPEMGQEVAALIPNARFLIFERSGHMLPYEEDQRPQQEVLGFLAE